jgi:tetratricopeptide (TPR) repeat protein
MKSTIILIALFISGMAFSQNVPFEKDYFKENKDGLKEAKDNIKEGDELFLMGPGHYKNAIDFFVKANDFNPNNAELNYKLGVCYLSSIEKYKALPFLEKAFKLDPNVNPELDFYLGRAYHLEMKFDDYSLQQISKSC